MSLPSITIVLPVLNEAASLRATLAGLLTRTLTGACPYQIILVDGGSTDDTLAIAAEFPAVQVIQSEAGRARQMNAGAREAIGELLLFLHGDTILPDVFLSRLQNEFWHSDKAWGRFDVRLSGDQYGLRLIETMMNLRSRFTGICTGDQAMFVRRSTFIDVGGFPNQPLMEDITLSARLKKYSMPFCIRDKLTTSSRRWQSQGIVATILLMWRLRLLYFFGISPDKLFKMYYK